MARGRRRPAGPSRPGTDPTSPQLPRKRDFRQRAHANPFSDHTLVYPTSPACMDWAPYFPHFFVPPDQPQRAQQQQQQQEQQQQQQHEQQPQQQQERCQPRDPDQAPPRLLHQNVEVLDLGCGFGGLLVALAPVMPDTLLLGLEIRTRVTTYVQERIQALRAQHAAHAPPHQFQNIACIRANGMKFLPNFFARAQLSKLFLCFPDPHFKARKHKARIVSTTINSEYAYVLRPGGIVYTVTDVRDLHDWIVAHFDAHPLFARLPEPEKQADACVAVMCTHTEEAKKVLRVGGLMFVALYRRLPDPPWPADG